MIWPEDELGRIETDRAVESSSLEPTVFDSGFASGGLLPASSPNHKASSPTCQQQQQQQKLSESSSSGGGGVCSGLTTTTQRPLYQTQDSGICEIFNRVNLTDTEIHEPVEAYTLQQQQQQQQLPQLPRDKILEYYDADADGDCQLHLAVADGVAEVVLALIRMAPNPTFLDIQNNELYAPIHLAVLVNQPAMVRQLVVAGAATDIRDREGNTPLHLAARRGLKECAVALLSPIRSDELREAAVAGATHTTDLHAVLNTKNYNGEHCVHLATFGRHYEFLAFLADMSANMAAKEGRSGKTALHYAVNMRDERLVQMLAADRAMRGCGVALNERDWAGRTALQCARINGDTNIQNFLASLPGIDTSIDSDYEFDSDEDAEYNDIEVNGMMVVEASA